MRRLFNTFIILVVSVTGLSSQDWDSLSVMATRWADSFVEWDFYPSVEEDEPTGTLTMRWLAQNDWTAWDYRFGEKIGDVTTQWRDRFDEWVVQSEGQRVTLKTRWPGDLSEWRINDGNDVYILSVVNRNDPQEWEVLYQDSLTFQIYTEFEGDYRSWLIYQAGNKLPDTTQMALIFAVIVSTAPRS